MSICPYSVAGFLTNFAESIQSESVFPVTEPAWYSHIQNSVPECHSSITKYWLNLLSLNIYTNENKSPLSPHNPLSPCTTTNLSPLSPYNLLSLCTNTNLSPLSPCTNTNLSLLIIIYIQTWKYSPQKCTEPARCTNVKLKDVLTYCKV